MSGGPYVRKYRSSAYLVVTLVQPRFHFGPQIMIYRVKTEGTEKTASFATAATATTPLFLDIFLLWKSTATRWFQLVGPQSWAAGGVIHNSSLEACSLPGQEG